MSPPASRLVCGGCGGVPDPGDPYPFRCPQAGVGDVDHVLVRVLDLDRVRFPEGPAGTDSTFVRYRGLLHSCHRATAAGVSDEEFTDLVTRLDDAVARVAGVGFRATPFARDAALSERLGFSAAGGVWVKDETGNVAGSHKGRHLMGVLLHLEVAERLGLADPADRPDLAIASCGNAALAAAVVARAADRQLRVFVPVDADPVVLGGLRDLGADVVTCERTPDTDGDPAYVRLRAELAAGALPFTCQGTENGLVIEGGETLGYEIAADLHAEGNAVDHLVVQVGGGALASACIQALDEAVRLGALDHRPRVHTVQTTGGHPLRSIATGILDDETYDWRAVVGGMLTTGGRPLVVTEDCLARAHDLGRAAGYCVDPTGTSGLAGLLDLVAAGDVDPDARVGVLFTGVER